MCHSPLHNPIQVPGTYPCVEPLGEVPQTPLAGTTVLELAAMGDVGDARVPVWLDCDPGIALRDGMVQDANASPTLLLLR